MLYPCLHIDLSKIAHNARLINDRCTSLGISVVGITKCVLGDIRIARVLKKAGIKVFGDSRMQNLKKLRDYFGYGQPLILLRTPMHSELEELVQTCEVSMQTDIGTVKKLFAFCKAKNIRHKIVLMVETDDKREGILMEEAFSFVQELKDLREYIELWAIGTNARCLCEKAPSRESIEKVIGLRDRLERRFGIRIPMISGGNSSLWTIIKSGDVPEGLNQIRIGEAIFIGNETATYQKIDGAYRDAFELQAQIIELKRKAKTGLRAIAALGIADAGIKNIIPIHPSCDIISQSSDHSVLSFHKDFDDIDVGSIIKFSLDYFGVLSCMISPYVRKHYLEGKS